MGNIYQSYFKMYRYSLRGALGYLEISQPIGWGEDNKVFKRSTECHGVFINLSSNLYFYIGDENNDGGYNYLKNTYETYGINATVSLVKEENISGTWEESYRGFFDFSTYSRNNTLIEIMFNESGIYEKIKSRNSEDLELDRLTTMDGTVLGPLKTELMELQGRKILIISELNRTKGDGSWIQVPGNMFVAVNNGENDSKIQLVTINRDIACIIPLTMIAEQDGNVQTIYGYEIRANASAYENGTTGSMFYAVAENDNTITVDFDIEFASVEYNRVSTLKVDLVKFSNGISYEYASTTTLLTVNPVNQGQVYSLKQSGVKIPLLANESLALAIRAENNNGIETIISVTKASVIITDETYYPSTQSKFVLPFEALERVVNVITDKGGVLKSNALGRTDLGYLEDGYASLTGLTNGFWVREFNTEKITTSFKAFIDSFNVVWQIGYGIEKIGFNEILRVEHISHFYQYVVTLKLGGDAPKKITRACAKDYYYSSLEIGYSAPSGTVLYEEVLGLDEYNIRNNYTTAITKIENKNTLISPYRADSYGTEFARRKPKAKFPEEDTRYDLSVMVNDLKRGVTNVFSQRKWEDDFEVPNPFNRFTTGVYSPETATNLRFSPMNILKRWGFWIKGGLMKNLNEYIRYSSSNGNSSLKTKSLEQGSIETAENGNVLNSDLNKNLFNGDIIKFKFPVDSSMLKTLNGTTVFNGETIMNYYGLIEFTNEDGDLETGFLLSLEPNGEGEWELLSSTKRINKQSQTSTDNGKIIAPSDLTARSSI